MSFNFSPRLTSTLGQMFGADLRSLAALRISIAQLVLFDLGVRSTDLVAHYTDFGVIPRAIAINESHSRWLISLHFLSGAWQVQAVLFLIATVLAVALLVGYRTRLLTIVSWFLLCSLQTRNSFVNGGGDIMLRVILFWCMFLPWGARCSLDSVWRASSEEVSKRCLSLGTIAFIVQFFYIYWFTVILKTGPEWRSEGSAIYYALSLDYLATGLGQILLQFPLLLKWMTYGILGFEFLGPLLLVVSPLLRSSARTVVICGFLLLHIGILLTLRLGMFPVLNIACMTFFLPTEFWDKISARFQSPSKFPPKIYFDGNCGFCWRWVQIIRNLARLPDTAVIPAQNGGAGADMTTHNSWVIEMGTSRYFGYEAFVVIVSASSVLWPVAPALKLAPLRWLGEKLYCYLSTHHRVACDIGRMTDATAIPGLKLSWFSNIVLALLLTYLLVWNISTVPDSGVKISERLSSLGYVLRLDQNWNMFAPGPAKGDGWYVIPGKLQSGQIVDVLAEGKVVDWRKPPLISDTFKNYHWRKFMEIMRRRTGTALRSYYASYLCREWNRSYNGSSKLTGLELVFLLETTRPDYEYSPVEKIILLTHECATENPTLASPEREGGV